MEQFTQLIVVLASIILLAKATALLGRHFGVPSVSAQLLVGICLGPSLLNLLEAPVILGSWGSVGPTFLHSGLKIFAEIGLIQLMFLAGSQIDWNQLRTKLKPIFSIGVGGFVFGAAAAVCVARLFTDRWAEALGVRAIVASSSFGISAYNLSEMGLLGSKVSNISAGAAVLSGSLAILLMIGSLAANYAASFGIFKMVIALSWFMGKLVMFFAIAYFLTSRFLKLSARTGLRKSPWQMLIGYLLLVAAIYAWAAMHFGGFAAVAVASLGGALLSMSPFEMKQKIGKAFGSGPASLLMGVLFVAMGMELNLREARGQGLWLIVLLVTVAASKLIGVWLSSRKDSESLRERRLFMSGALPQGEVGILIAAYLFSRGLVNPAEFNISIILVVVLTMIAPVLMRLTMKMPLPDSLECGMTEQPCVRR